MRPPDTITDPAARLESWLMSGGDPDDFTPTPAEVIEWEGYTDGIVLDDGVQFTAIDQHGTFGSCWVILADWRGVHQRWQYRDYGAAEMALEQWRAGDAPEPTGWTKHTPSERRNG